MSVWEDAQAERERALVLHGDKAMDAYEIDDYARLAILMEEVGEVAREFNEAIQNKRFIDVDALRTELVQVTAMAGAWVDAIDAETPDG
jgi:NTP pyrophosphatase (non-canonical NTP hydrolase)